jgi:hypothetical protein
MTFQLMSDGCGDGDTTTGFSATDRRTVNFGDSVEIACETNRLGRIDVTEAAILADQRCSSKLSSAQH